MSEEEKLPVAVQRPEIVDPYSAEPFITDWLVTSGLHEGIVNLTFGAIDHSFRKEPEDLARVMIVSRLRLSQAFAERLHYALGELLGKNAPDAMPPVQAPPKNLVN